jgi:hypothetical protein
VVFAAVLGLSSARRSAMTRQPPEISPPAALPAFSRAGAGKTMQRPVAGRNEGKSMKTEVTTVEEFANAISRAIWASAGVCAVRVARYMGQLTSPTD